MVYRRYFLLSLLLMGCVGLEDPDAGIFRNSALLPVEVVGNRTWSDVEAGFSHTCALTTDGEAYCWGDNNYLQTGSTVDVSCGHGERCVRTPRAVLGGHRFVQIAAGGNMSCGLTAAGALWCWGGGEGTYLGNGTFSSSTLPVQVAADSLFMSVSRVTGGGCALTASGQAWCWGQNFGALGDGSTTPQPSPVPIGGALRFTHLDKNSSHSCGITTDGALYCWGGNRWGQLVAGEVPFNNCCDVVTTPTATVATGTYIDVAVGGNDFTCAIRADGQVECAGYNGNGLLGDNSAISHRGTLAPVAGGLMATQIAAGIAAVCALATDGSAYCWGENWFGGLGIGTRSDLGEGTPQRVQGGPFTKISVGGGHTCAITPTQRLFCWGSDVRGAIGRP